MKPELQQTAIAEACGWKLDLATHKTAIWKGPSGEMCGHGQYPPDYLNDLNAVHEAEKVLNFQQRSEFTSRLSSMVSHGFDFCHATATQRAEAFLRTLGLWIEEDTKP